MKFEALEFDTAHQAIEHAEAAGGVAIRMDGKHFCLTGDQIDRLLEHRGGFAFLANHNGTIVTIPTNS